MSWKVQKNKSFGQGLPLESNCASNSFFILSSLDSNMLCFMWLLYSSFYCQTQKWALGLTFPLLYVRLWLTSQSASRPLTDCMFSLNIPFFRSFLFQISTLRLICFPPFIPFVTIILLASVLLSAYAQNPHSLQFLKLLIHLFVNQPHLLLPYPSGVSGWIIPVAHLRAS